MKRFHKIERSVAQKRPYYSPGYSSSAEHDTHHSSPLQQLIADLDRIVRVLDRQIHLGNLHRTVQLLQPLVPLSRCVFYAPAAKNIIESAQQTALALDATTESHLIRQFQNRLCVDLLSVSGVGDQLSELASDPSELFSLLPRDILRSLIPFVQESRLRLDYIGSVSLSVAYMDCLVPHIVCCFSNNIIWLNITTNVHADAREISPCNGFRVILNFTESSNPHSIVLRNCTQLFFGGGYITYINYERRIGVWSHRGHPFYELYCTNSDGRVYCRNPVDEDGKFYYYFCRGTQQTQENIEFVRKGEVLPINAPNRSTQSTHMYVDTKERLWRVFCSESDPWECDVFLQENGHVSHHQFGFQRDGQMIGESRVSSWRDRLVVWWHDCNPYARVLHVFVVRSNFDVTIHRLPLPKHYIATYFDPVNGTFLCHRISYRQDSIDLIAPIGIELFRVDLPWDE